MSHSKFVERGIKWAFAGLGVPVDRVTVTQADPFYRVEVPTGYSFTIADVAQAVFEEFFGIGSLLTMSPTLAGMRRGDRDVYRALVKRLKEYLVLVTQERPGIWVIVVRVDKELDLLEEALKSLVREYRDRANRLASYLPAVREERVIRRKEREACAV